MKDCGTIILCTLNGAAFLPAQLQSILDQTHSDWTLIAADDGSQDETRHILTQFQNRHPGKVILKRGPQNGFGANFLQTLRYVPPNAPWLAFADQDDVWHRSKISRALQMLAHIRGPALYCGRQSICDAHLKVLGQSRLPTRPLTFGNALVQNVAAGNTIVLNQDAISLLRQCHISAQVFHDWFTYQLITGHGGTVIYDPVPQILYRQHGTNIIGAAYRPKDAVERIVRLFNGAHAHDLANQTAALLANADMLNLSGKAQLTAWIESLAALPHLRSKKILQAEIYRHGRLAPVAMHIAATLGLLGRPAALSYGSRKASFDL